jgi:hypothetical protein
MMSYPYPEDRTRQKRTKGEQPYKDAREKLNTEQVELQDEAEEYGEAKAGELKGPRTVVQREAIERADAEGEDIPEDGHV